MRYVAIFIPLLVTLLTWSFSPSVQVRPRALTKQQRIANILAQKPLHTTALLAGAAAMPTPSPYPPGSSDLGYTERPRDNGEDEDWDSDDDGSYKIQVEL
ncbi:MAG: hypothetical protein L6R36_008629 [Xanthoria steineri]|nr:MAG: hypothetical protein L6R36_008629 [Xanthoria steineri]